MVEMDPPQHDLEALAGCLEPIFRDYPEIAAVYLFGSWCAGKQGPRATSTWAWSSRQAHSPGSPIVCSVIWQLAWRVFTRPGQSIWSS